MKTTTATLLITNSTSLIPPPLKKEREKKKEKEKKKEGEIGRESSRPKETDRDPHLHKCFCLMMPHAGCLVSYTRLYLADDSCGCFGFLPLCLALCRCQSAFLSTYLVEML